MLHLFFVIAVIGFIAYIVTLIPMPPVFKQVIYAIAIFVIVVMAIQFAAGGGIGHIDL